MEIFPQNYNSSLLKRLRLRALQGCFPLGHLQKSIGNCLKTLRCSGLRLTNVYNFSPSLHPMRDRGSSCNSSLLAAMRFTASLRLLDCFITLTPTCQGFILCWGMLALPDRMKLYTSRSCWRCWLVKVSTGTVFCLTLMISLFDNAWLVVGMPLVLMASSLIGSNLSCGWCPLVWLTSLRVRLKELVHWVTGSTMLTCHLQARMTIMTWSKFVSGAVLTSNSSGSWGTSIFFDLGFLLWKD